MRNTNTHWSQIGWPKNVDSQDMAIPFDARFFGGKQTLPPPPPPPPSDELTDRQKEQEAREAQLLRLEDQRRQREEGLAQANAAGGENKRLQAQFRQNARRQQGRAEGPQTGLRL